MRSRSTDTVTKTRRGRRLAAIALGLIGAAALSSAAWAQQGGNILRNLLLFGGTTEPKSNDKAVNEIDCPQVDVAPGGAALMAYGGRVGDPNALRNQLTIANLARECIVQPDGSVLVKVGVEGRALLGPSGSGGRFDAPLRFVVKRGDKVLGTRARRVAVAIPSGETQASFTVVEDGLVVPAQYASDFEIEVALGSAKGGAAPARRKGGRG